MDAGPEDVLLSRTLGPNRGAGAGNPVRRKTIMSHSAERATPPGCGAFLNSDGVCRWHVWAPRAQTVQLVLFDHQGRRSAQGMRPAEHGGFTFTAGGIAEGQRYAFSLDGGKDVPDPASRWQPDGVHAPSAVWNPAGSPWSDSGWRGISREDLVIYELHVGTFTREGTLGAIVPRLESLRELGITAIELMPLAQFPGLRNWGYDGTFWYAVQNSYGGPRELQRLVNTCHAAGMAVMLDVIYNHLGPEGNYLGEFGPYFTDRHHTPWGRALNYDDRGSDEVREFVLNNVRQWVRDFHVDGLRLDAVHSIYDTSARHILGEIKRVADEEAARRGFPVQIIAESNLNDVRLLHPPELGGYGLDAQWSDDFHHAVHTLLTGEREGYYADFHSPAEQLVKALNDTFVYDGQYSPARGRRHGAPAGDLSGDRFVVSIQTHDQVGNRARGERLSGLVEPAQLRLAAALMLLSPHVPMLFMGEEYGEERAFPFFCDFGDPDLQEAVRRGRREEFAEFGWSGEIPDPQEERTFLASQLTWSWPDESWKGGLRRLYHDLLAARRTWPALRDFRHRTAELLSTTGGGPLLGFVRGDPAHPARQIVVRFNLGPTEIPLPAERVANRSVLLSTESPRYGGTKIAGIPPASLSPFEGLVLGQAVTEGT